MNLAAELKSEIDSSQWFYRFSFLLGAVAMVVAGYFLVIGLSKFGGDEATRSILILGAILFQVIESFCFVGAAGFAFHSRRWQLTLFALGCVLFVFSLFVMTLAQKTAMYTGEMQAGVIDSRVKHIEEQIGSYDKLIKNYEFNSEKQSRSIYKESRALGQESLNKAALLEEKKMALAAQLFALEGQRRQTSMDFFTQLATLTGLDAGNLEWYFMIGRSVLFELCGIILLSFGVTLKGRFMKRYLDEYDQTGLGYRPETVPGTVTDGAGYSVPARYPGTAAVPETGTREPTAGTAGTKNRFGHSMAKRIVPPAGNRPEARQHKDSVETVAAVLAGTAAETQRRATRSVPENLRSEYILKPGQDTNNGTGETVPDDTASTETVPDGTASTETVPGTGAGHFVPGTEYRDVKNGTGPGAIVPVMVSTNIVALDKSRNKQVLEKLDPTLRPLVHDAIAAYERNEINKFTREQVRTVLRINSKNAGIVAKAAKQIKESGTALSL